MYEKTANYQLNQWEAGDNFLRTDFNEDNAKIDAAIAGKPNIYFGTYTGTGTDSRTISLGYTPKALFTCTRDGRTGTSNLMCWGGLVLSDQPVKNTSGSTVVEIVDGGFKVYGSNANGSQQGNISGLVYHYMAIA